MLLCVVFDGHLLALEYSTVQQLIVDILSSNNYFGGMPALMFINNWNIHNVNYDMCI